MGAPQSGRRKRPEVDVTAPPDRQEARARSRGPFEQVVLVGFMGSGKTEVGQRLAELLEWEFIDSDKEIEEEVGLTIPAIFDQLGEPAFRQAERSAVEQALTRTEVVVSTGGGWPESEGTMESIPKRAFVAWLQVSADEALRRVGRTSGRPLLNRADAPAFARDLLRRRVKRYALAHHLYDTSSAAPQEIAERIRSAVRPLVTGPTKKEE